MANTPYTAEDLDAARRVRVQSGAWRVLRYAQATGRVELWKHGKGFVTQCVNAGLVVREGTDAVLTPLGQAAADILMCKVR